ncbi:hypothetical protein D3C71_998350 [compost metagenome]
MVADDLAHGRLRRIFPDWHGEPVPVYALTETRLLPAKTLRFIEFLRSGWRIHAPINEPLCRRLLLPDVAGVVVGVAHRQVQHVAS